jgi:hypothetical protein
VFPAEAAIPVANTLIGVAASAARPVIGLGIFATLLVLFKPLLTGLLQAALLVISPRKSLKERKARNSVKGAMMLNRMARDLDSSEPSLAAELRSIASRG